MDKIQIKSGADRQRKYREQNKEQAKLSDAKKKVKDLNRRISDPEFAEKTKEKID